MALLVVALVVAASCSTSIDASSPSAPAGEERPAAQDPERSPWRWILYGAIAGAVIAGVLIAIVLIRDDDGFLEDETFTDGEEGDGSDDGLVGL